jgi:hypothetical protein
MFISEVFVVWGESLNAFSLSFYSILLIIKAIIITIQLMQNMTSICSFIKVHTENSNVSIIPNTHITIQTTTMMTEIVSMIVPIPLALFAISSQKSEIKENISIPIKGRHIANSGYIKLLSGITNQHLPNLSI